jgi:MSHA biogenesis protein MshQ
MRRLLLSLVTCSAILACGLDDTVVDEEGNGPDAGRDASIDSSSLDATLPDGSILPRPDSGPPPASGYEKSITIHASKIAATLTDFPVWIDLTGDADLAAHAAVDGSDIHFTDASGTELSYEIQNWTVGTGDLAAWVKIPNLPTTADTTIYVRYAKSAGVPAPNSAAVFSGHFVSVWHLETPAPSLSFPDAVGGHTGTGSNISSSPTTAQLGGGVAFDGGVGEITFTNALSGNSPSTISLWVSQGATTDNDALVVLGTSAADQSRWLHSVYNPNATSPTNVAIGFYGDDWSNPETNVDIIGAGWTHLVWVYDGTTSTIYKNGALADGPHSPTGTVSTQGTTGYLGNAPSPAYGVNMGAHATIDEVRISNVARPAAWIAAEYANQNSPTTFYAVGAEQSAP